MKKILSIFILLPVLFLHGCYAKTSNAQVVATTRPVYDFTVLLCQNTDITVDLLVTENISCLHDYTLQVSHMRAIESAEAVVLSGAGLEDFLSDALVGANAVIDSSLNVPTLCGGHEHEHIHEEHHHDEDPHIWLSISNARIMAENICSGLSSLFPQHRESFQANLNNLNRSLDELDCYGKQQLSELQNKDIITFHDGFGYFADYWDLHILHSLEEESGSEASAGELKELIGLVRENTVPAIFVEENGSISAAQVVSRETGVKIFTLNMGMSDMNYLETMYHNIDIIKEALE